DYGPRYTAADDFALIPMAEAHLSAGVGAFVLLEKIKEYYVFRKERLRRMATSRNNLALMTIQGYTMEPTIHAWNVVLIDTDRKKIYDGNIHALGRLDETIVIKRLELLSGEPVRIFGDNISPEYTPEIAHMGQIRVISRVIWLAKGLVKGEL
ncbi:MAG: helix-turn-helix transcriptional regulator, partial [Deltaproteobacteria bacterium]|nr:helix-turn-helix transcriptional regulator [Deltaproteobacteria bacterium]